MSADPNLPVDSAAEASAADLAAAREALAERTARATALEQENGALNEQVLRAYHRMKQDETIVARARKALGIALALLDDDGPRSNKPQ
jgi:cell division protein FtsB